MNTFFINFKQASVSVIFLFISVLGFSQAETSKWKAQIALGVNSPNSSGFVSGFEAKSINFPTINLGLQHMFKRQFGAKLDFGYNRIAHDGSSPYFKVNYSRINAQFIYDPTPVFTFLPIGMGVVAHAGPGFSMIKPLGEYGGNKTSFLNVMAGIEFHYSITDVLTVYLDTSYIYGFGSDFDPVSDGFGSFSGNLLTATIGVSYSLSGCYYCD
ncbi:cell envelope biogenesis protein OmpA [Xanthomarina sp. F2636L]|uniref:cell envelope biogenesis protein OmpA n=1 Tax=Xanthomarina sp. F2636L TaxID=2996018 RepID=UPI00225E42D2|nr:cell envelope biogenesis protein OmpA [Xanthomarina sp. F2636L]MCX7550953.1 cell envelope biogenesis protein OmpA [Xanthomarina sp. F2636L]